jgi:hypothetical protein
MAVIYCDNCEVGVHHTDICWGGKNGKPRLTKQEHRNLTIRYWTIAIGIVFGINAIVLFLLK